MKSRSLKGPLDRPQLLSRFRITLESISDFFARDSSFVDSIDGIKRLEMFLISRGFCCQKQDKNSSASRLSTVVII